MSNLHTTRPWRCRLSNLHTTRHTHEGPERQRREYGPAPATVAHLLVSVPFVLGMPGWRGSASTAIRNARAAALNTASAMW